MNEIVVSLSRNVLSWGRHCFCNLEEFFAVHSRSRIKYILRKGSQLSLSLYCTQAHNDEITGRFTLSPTLRAVTNTTKLCLLRLGSCDLSYYQIDPCVTSDVINYCFQIWLGVIIVISGQNLSTHNFLKSQLVVN